MGSSQQQDNAYLYSPSNTWPSISLKSLVAYPSTRLKSLYVTLAFFVKKIISKYTKAIKRGDELHIYNYLKITAQVRKHSSAFNKDLDFSSHIVKRMR